MADPATEVERHYMSDDLGARILAALDGAGIDMGNLTPEDLAPMDQLHSGGWALTEALAGTLDLGPRMHVLDIGCGIGGPARYLAHTFGCRVTGLDLLEPFCRAATMLTAWTGLDERVDFRHGSALEMPFPDAGFDVAWSQNVTMNIEDKQALYGEQHRVLRPGGHLAFAEVALGPVGEVIYPVPWARDPAISFLVPPDEMRAGLEAAGFRIVEWGDETASLVAQRDTARAQAKSRPEPGKAALGAHIVFGADIGERVANSMKNMDEGRTLHIRALAERAG